MTITDAIFESINNLLDDCMFYFDDNPNDILKEDDLINIIALKLKIINTRGYLKTDYHKIPEIDWQKKAYEFIEEYVEEQGGQGGHRPHM